MTNYDRALIAYHRQKTEDRLVCPKCQAANRPGAHVIELSDQDGWADCAVCAHHYAVDVR